MDEIMYEIFVVNNFDPSHADCLNHDGPINHVLYWRRRFTPNDVLIYLYNNNSPVVHQMLKQGLLTLYIEEC